MKLKKIFSLFPEKLEKVKQINEPKKKIYIYDRASQFDLLQNVEGTYMWISPIPFNELTKYNLIQKQCSDAKTVKDIIIYNNQDKLTDLENNFIKRLKEHFNSFILLNNP